MFFSRVLAASALVGAAAAQSSSGTFSILSPGGPNLWWVAGSQNTLVWTCHTNAPATTYTLLVNNTNQQVLAAPQAIIAGVPNADCSHTITQDQANFAPGTGYTVLLGDSLNQTHIFATSEEFEIKALGATYPPTSATPTEGGSSSTSASASGTASGSGSGGAAAASPTSSSNAAHGLAAPLTAGAFAVVGAAFGLF